MKINIKSECGKNTVTRPDGEKIRKLIEEKMKKADVVEIDFGHARIASVSFLDEVFGQLALKYSLEELKKRLRLINPEKFDLALINDILTSRSRQRKMEQGQAA